MTFQLTLPDIGEGVVEAEVQRWFVAPGDAVVEDQPLVEVMTDKATVTIPSPRSGRVARLCREPGEVARVHETLIELEVDAAPDATAPLAAAGARTPTPAPTTATAPAGRAGKALATPAVRAMARSMGVDIQGVHGSGKGGRVTKEDLAAAAQGGNGSRPANGHSTPFQAPSPAAAGSAAPGREERIPLTGLRKRIAENMARSKRTAAHFTFVEQADVSELVRFKHRVADAARAEGVRLTYLPFVVKAVVAALKAHPLLNASLDDERHEVVMKRRYDIGIAAATHEGLTVPVVREADRLSLLDLAREIARVAGDAKAGRSRPEDVGNSTFTITSMGGRGGLFGTPVLNFPEVGILGVHRIRPTPVVRDRQVVVRDVMYVSMTGDHRVVDGQTIAAFTYQVIKYLEDPGLLFMQMV